MRQRLATVLYRVARRLDPSQEERHLDAISEAISEFKRQADLLREFNRSRFIADVLSERSY